MSRLDDLLAPAANARVVLLVARPETVRELVDACRGPNPPKYSVVVHAPDHGFSYVVPGLPVVHVVSARRTYTISTLRACLGHDVEIVETNPRVDDDAVRARAAAHRERGKGGTADNLEELLRLRADFKVLHEASQRTAAERDAAFSLLRDFVARAQQVLDPAPERAVPTRLCCLAAIQGDTDCGHGGNS